MTPFVLFAALGAGGLHQPWLWTPFAVLSWGAAAALLPRARLPGGPLWGALLAWAAASALLSPEPLISLSAFAYAATAFLWLSLGATRAGADERRWGAALLMAAGPLAAAAAILIDVPDYPAVGLLFPYYNYTAALVAAAGAAAAAGPAAATAVPAAALYLVWAGSRGGLAALAAGTAVALWRGGRRKTVVLGAAAALAFLAGSSTPRDILLKADKAGAHARPAIWRAALQVAAESPWLGEGPGRFGRGFLRHQVPAPPSLRPTRFSLTTAHAHSGPLDVLAEVGFPGAVLLTAALLALWRARPVVTDPDREALLTGAVALGTQALGDSILVLPALAWLFAWLLGAACASENAQVPRLPESARRAFLLLGLGLAAAAWWPGWAVSSWRGAEPEAAVTVAPADAGLWQDIARRRLGAGDARGGLAALARAAELRPFDVRPRIMAAEVLRSGGAWHFVLEAASEVVALEPACGQGRILKAEALLRLGRPAEARAELAALPSSGAKPLTDLRRDNPEGLVLGYDPARLAALQSELK
ncbi:MAG: O-antigen ligase family protein [Elusimicrobia bacterium]|nr:O-antigen ligase family protein [Elusimicrobiota bacterium]